MHTSFKEQGNVKRLRRIGFFTIGANTRETKGNSFASFASYVKPGEGHAGNLRAGELKWTLRGWAKYHFN